MAPHDLDVLLRHRPAQYLVARRECIREPQREFCFRVTDESQALARRITSNLRELFRAPV